MKKRMYSTLAVIAMVLVFVSCSEDDDFPAPVISDLEVGHDNSQVGYRGSDLHIDAGIVAEGRIDRVIIEIHYEGDHHHDSGKNGDHDDHDWEFEHTWTEFNGLLNTRFHKHIDIPVEAETGHYHFHFIVIDMQGKTTELERDLEIKNPEGTSAPAITVTSAPGDGAVFHIGDEISIAGTVTHDMALGGMYIGLVRENQNLEDEEVNSSNTITLLHTHDFDEPASHAFDASIEVGAEYDNNITPKPIKGDIAWEDGAYYILVKSRDAFGGPFGLSERYHIDIHMH